MTGALVKPETMCTMNQLKKNFQNVS
jgi:hypothetical protein